MRKNIEKKKKQVEELKKLLKPTVVLLNLQKVPGHLFHNLRKKVRGKGIVKVYKKTVIERALKTQGIELGDPKVSLGLFLTDLSPYKAFWEVKKAAQGKRYAKAGDVAEEDIYVEAQETQFQPGPILSDFKAAGLKVKIDKGKIVISERSLVAKKGEVINELKASVLQKLDIKPFDVQVNILAVYHGAEHYPAEILNIAPADVGEGIKSSLQQGLNISVNASYPTPMSIGFLIGNAVRQAQALSVNANYPSPASIKFLISKAVVQQEALKKVIENEG